MPTVAFVLGALALATPGPKPAGAGASPLVERVRELERRVQAGDWAGAAELSREIERAVADRAPLQIVDLQVLGAPPEGLGMYTELFGGEVRGEDLYVYAQVRNHAIRAAHGFHELHLVTDLVLLDAKGAELARDPALGESRFNARTPHRDTFVVIALRTAGLAPGDYRLRVVLHDEIARARGGDRSAAKEVSFRIPRR